MMLITCADIWVGKVKHSECFLPDQGNELEMPVPQQSPKEVPHDSNVLNIKSILEGLAEREISGQAKVNLQRTFVWNDFKGARLRKRVMPKNLVKVIFLREPAIDDGGPRREFFSGMIYLSSIFQYCNSFNNVTPYSTQNYNILIL